MAIQFNAGQNFAGKPFKGELWDVRIIEFNAPTWDGKFNGQQTLRKYATGFKDAYKFANYWRTSLIVAIEGDMIETLNSYYRIMRYAKEPL